MVGSRIKSATEFQTVGPVTTSNKAKKRKQVLRREGLKISHLYLQGVGNQR